MDLNETIKDLSEKFECLANDLRVIAALYDEEEFQTAAFRLGDICGKCTARANVYRLMVEAGKKNVEEPKKGS